MLLLGPGSSSVVNLVKAWLSLSASFLQHWGVEGRGGLPLLAAGQGEGWQGWGFGGWLSWGRSAGQGWCLWLLWETTRAPLVLGAQTSHDLPFKSSFSTASVSFVTPGFHTALRAVKACSVMMRMVFPFFQSFFYTCVVFEVAFILPSTPTPFIPSQNYTPFSVLLAAVETVNCSA